MNDVADDGASILVAEDDEMTLAAFCQWIRAAGFKAIAATNGQQALRLALQEKPLLAVLDITMDEGMSGIDVARHLDERTDVGYLFVTGAAEPETVAAASPNALGYLVKPIVRSQLEAAVRSAAVRMRAGKELRSAERRAAIELAQSRTIYLASGVLMERQWLSSEEALVRLNQRALDARVSLIVAAQSLLDEVAQKAR